MKKPIRLKKNKSVSRLSKKSKLKSKKNKVSVKVSKNINIVPLIKKSTKKPTKKHISKNVEALNSKPVDTPIVTSTPSVVQSEKPQKKKSASKMYFTEDTQKHIVLYNNEENMDIRNELYNNHIKHAFEKLVENIFNTFKFIYFDNSPLEIQKETVAHLVANINKYKEEFGKAFSYFSIVAKNYLIFHNNNNYTRFNRHVDISETPSETTVCLQIEDPHHKQTELSEFVQLVIEYWEKNVGKIFTKQRDLNIANAVIEIIRKNVRIESFNKKALYLYIREISLCKTQQITKVINKMKEYQRIITENYYNNGTLDEI